MTLSKTRCSKTDLIKIAWIPFALAVLFVLPSLDNALVSDDFELIEESIMSQPSNVIAAFTETGLKGFYRPVPRVLLAFNYAFHGLDGFGYYAVNGMLHIVATVFLALLAFAITGKPSASVVSGVLFAVHFVHVETVYWVAARNELLTVATYLMALNCLAFRIPGYRYVVPLLCLVALLCKETAVTLPLSLALVGLLQADGSGSERIRSGMRCSLSGFGALAAYGLIRLSVGADWPWTSREVSFDIDPLLAIKNALQYVVQMLLPVRALLDLQSSESYGAATVALRARDGIPWYWLLIAAAGIAAVLRFATSLGGKQARFGLFLSLIALLPFLLMDGTATRHLYLASAGASLTAAALLDFDGPMWTGKVRTRLFRAWLVPVSVVILLLLSLEQSRWWDLAGHSCSQTIDRAVREAENLGDHQTLYVVGIPRRIHGAYVLQNGFEAAVRLSRPQLQVNVIDGERALDRGESRPPESAVLDLSTGP